MDSQEDYYSLLTNCLLNLAAVLIFKPSLIPLLFAISVVTMTVVVTIALFIYGFIAVGLFILLSRVFPFLRLYCSTMTGSVRSSFCLAAGQAMVETHGQDGVTVVDFTAHGAGMGVDLGEVDGGWRGGDGLGKDEMKGAEGETKRKGKPVTVEEVDDEDW